MRGYVTIFTDASYCDRTGCYGIAVWIKYGDGQVIRFTDSGLGREVGSGKPLSKRQIIDNSSKAEKLALDTAVKALRRYRVPLNGVIVVLQSDCEWALNNVRIKPISKTVKEVRRKHVKAHRGHQCARSSVNTWCDRQARKRMRARRAELIGEVTA